MKRKSTFRFSMALILVMCFCTGYGQVLTQEFIDAGYTMTDLGSINLLPSRYGGLTIRSDEPNALYIGGNANNSDGAIYKVLLTRDAVTNHITGFAGDAVLFSEGANNDGGLFFAPNGTMLFTQYNINQLGQRLTNNTITTTDLDLVGIQSSVGSVALVPTGYSGAGNLIFASYNAELVYNIPYTIDVLGQYILAYKSDEVNISPAVTGPEGIAYIPIGSTGFTNPSMLISSYGTGKVVVFEVGPAGLPDVATAREMITGLSGAEGAWIDPITGDFIFSTFGGGDKIIRVSGFKAPSGTGNEVSPAFGLTISPNPVKGMVTVKIEKAVSGTIQIYNSLGSIIFTRKVTGSGSFMFDMSSHPDGVYFVKLTTGGSTVTSKFIVSD